MATDKPIKVQRFDNYNSFGYGERIIAEEAKRYEDKYFRDLTLKERDSKRMFDGIFQNGVPDISLHKWKFYTRGMITGSKGYDPAGFCDDENSTIYIKKALAEDIGRRKMILIHEMIHAYEWSLKGIIYDSGIVSQLMIIRLYRKLILMDSKEHIDQIINIFSDSRFWENGHDLLFMLKSIELDLLLGLPFGTIFGDRGELIEYLLSIPQHKRKKVMQKYWNYSWDCVP